MISKLLTVVFALLCLISTQAAAQKSRDAGGTNRLRPSDIFQFTNVWTIHLRFTPELWEAMAPKQAGGPQFGSRRRSFLQGPEGGRNGIAAAFGIVFGEERFGAKKGAIFKPVTPTLFSDLGDDWKNYNQTYDPKGELSEEQKRRVIEFSKFVSTASESEFSAKIGEFLDTDNFARYMAITAWLVDMDGILGPSQNYYVYLHPKSHKFLFIPWDQDQPFGQFPRGTEEERENLSIRKPWTGENRFLERVYKTESFKTAYLARLKEFNKSIFQPERIRRQVDELAPIIRGPIQSPLSLRVNPKAKR